MEVLVDDQGNDKKEEFRLSGYGSGNQVAEFVGQHDTICELSLDVDWSALVETFLEVWATNEVSFKWFRSSQINRRYVEEQFSYAVRLVELFFKSGPENDPAAEHALATIIQRADGDSELVEFVKRRISPILNGSPSLTSKLRNLYRRYPEFKAFSEIRPQNAVRLRGKEMHGADVNYTRDEYGEMYNLSRSFMLAFRVAILEQCGLDRKAIFEKISKTSLRDLLIQQNRS